MHKKFIAAVLIPALLIQLCGCYSMKEIPKDEIAGLKQGGDLIVRTNDSIVYFFGKSNYRISNDTLHGKGYVKTYNISDFRVVNEGAVALTNIETIQQDELNIVRTGLLSGGILLAVIVGVVIIFPSTHSNGIQVSPTYSGN